MAYCLNKLSWRYLSQLKSTCNRASILTKDTLIRELAEAQPHTGRESDHENMKIAEEGHPCRRLMFGYTCNNWNVYLCITAGARNKQESIKKN